MPTYKPRLNRWEQAKYLHVAEELSSGRVPIEIPDEWRYQAPALRVEIAGPPASFIYQLHEHLVVYVFRVRLFAESGSFILQDVQITPPWDRDVVYCGLEPGTNYRFAPGLEFEWDEVLNHQIENNLRLSRGHMLEGWLLATGNNPVPENYGPFMPAPLTVAFLDLNSREHTASAVVSVERSTKTTKSAAWPRTDLFEPNGPTETGMALGGKTQLFPPGPIPAGGADQKTKQDGK